MVISLTVAWATPVDCVALGARLEAYVETKAAISTFGICTQHAPSGTSLARLPAEVLGLVGALVQDFVFEDRQRAWIRDLCCCQWDCRPIDHFSDEEVSLLKKKYLGGDYEFLDGEGLDFEDELRNNYGGEREHERRMERYLRKVDELFRAPRMDLHFMRCKKIFTEDFGLEIFFINLHDSVPYENWHSERNPCITTLAYLILPSVQSAAEASSARNIVSAQCSMIIDASMLQMPSYEQKFRYEKAMNALKLTPKVHEMELTRLHPTSAPLRESAPRENEAKDSPIPWPRLRAELDRQAQALESTEWPKLMALMGGRHQVL